MSNKQVWSLDLGPNPASGGAVGTLENLLFVTTFERSDFDEIWQLGSPSIAESQSGSHIFGLVSPCSRFTPIGMDRKRIDNEPNETVYV